MEEWKTEDERHLPSIDSLPVLGHVNARVHDQEI